MGKYFLALFGLIGLAISVVQGIEPFIEVTRWVAWITDHWVEFSREIWIFLAAFFGLRITTTVADILTSLAYIVSLLIGTRRISGDPKGFAYNYLKKVESIDGKIDEKLSNLRLNVFPLNYIIALIFVTPLFIVCIFIYINSSTQALTLLLFVGLISITFRYLPNKEAANRIGAVIFGATPEGVDMEGRHMSLLAFSVVPLLVLCLVAGILAVNEIAANGENILNAYEWARCDAGIECKE